MPQFPNTDQGAASVNNRITNPASGGSFRRYESQANLTTQQPSAFAPESTAGQIAENNANSLAAATQTAFKFEDAYAKIQAANKKVNAESGFLDTLSRAQNDNSAQSPEEIEKLKAQYSQEIEKTKKDSLSGSFFQGTEKQTQLEINLAAKKATIQLDNAFKNKQIDYTRGVLIPQAIDNYAKSKFMLTSGSAQWNRINADLTNSADGWVKTGIISQEERHKFIQEVNKKQIMYEIASDPATDVKSSWTLNELKKGETGRYDSVDPIERNDLMKKALIKINENKKFAVEQTVDNRLNVLKEFADGKIDWQNSDALINHLTISDPKLGEAIRSATDKTFMPKADDEAFAEATQKVFSASSREEISNYLMHTLNQNANKEISKDRLAVLINAATERAKGLQTETGDHPATLSPKQIKIDSAIKSLLNANPLFSSADMVVNFFKQMNDGASSKDAHDSALKAEINRTNPLSVKYKVGDVVTNPQGLSGEIVSFNESGSPIIKRKK